MNIFLHPKGWGILKKMETKQKQEEIIDYYYNPNLECTCEAIFADIHRGYCKRRIRPKK